MKKGVIIVFLIVIGLLIIPVVIAPGTTTSAQVYLIKADDYTSEDYQFLQEIQTWMNNELGISGVIMHNVQVTKDELHDKFAVFIYDGAVIVIVGEDVHDLFKDILIEVEGYLSSSGKVTFCDVLINTELVSNDFKESLCEGPRTCKDSDYGKDFYSYGEVMWTNEAGGSGIEKDYCENNVLIENYCSSNRPYSKEYSCPQGCKDGECIGADTCKDSDGGINFYEAGSLDVGCAPGASCGMFSDRCIDDEKLLENYCSEGQPKEKYYYCNVKCEDGRCIGEAKCKDNDGKDYFIKGSVDFNGNIYTDYCLDSSTVIEKICLNDILSKTDYKCPEKCWDGKCIARGCQDSDLGVDYYKQGTIKLKHTYKTHTDTCTDEKTLQEYYCPMDGGDYAVSHYFHCSEGCENGRCLGEGTEELGIDKCLDNPNNFWDQETDKCFGGFNDLIIKYLCKDPDGGKDYYAVAHTFGFRSSYANEKDKRIRTGGKDSCLPDDRLIEHYCDEKGFIQTTYFRCPNGCEGNACIKGPLITEQVKCVFKNSEEEQECYLAAQGNTDMRCKGKETCIVEVKGYEGEKLTWKSSCGGYAYTKMDGENEYAEFDCSGGEKNTTDIFNKGFRYAYWQCTEGSEGKEGSEETCKPFEEWKKHAEKFCLERCGDSTEGTRKCGMLTLGTSQECYLDDPRETKCGNGVCESGEADYWSCPDCEEGKLCMAPCEYIEGTCSEDCGEEEPKCGDGICEENEKSMICIDPELNDQGEMTGKGGCHYVCPEDCENIKDILVCENSCPLVQRGETKCYPFGYRKSGQYCSDQGDFVNQKGSNKFCENNFECQSNVCVDDQCISQGLIRQIISWFRRLFGGE